VIIFLSQEKEVSNARKDPNQFQPYKGAATIKLPKKTTQKEEQKGKPEVIFSKGVFLSHRNLIKIWA